MLYHNGVATVDEHTVNTDCCIDGATVDERTVNTDCCMTSPLLPLLRLSH